MTQIGEEAVSDMLNIRIVASDVAQANRLAQSLSNQIVEAAPGTKIERRREDPTSMDFGTVLAILLAGPAAVAVAKGIEAWLTRHHGVELEFSDANGKVVAKNVRASDVVEIIKATKAGTTGSSSGVAP